MTAIRRAQPRGWAARGAGMAVTSGSEKNTREGFRSWCQRRRCFVVEHDRFYRLAVSRSRRYAPASPVGVVSLAERRAMQMRTSAIFSASICSRRS